MPPVIPHYAIHPISRIETNLFFLSATIHSLVSLDRSVQRDAGCAPAVLDVSSPLRSDQISGTSRESTLLVQASAGARLPDRIANLSSGRHGPPQPVQVTSSDRNVTLGCVLKPNNVVKVCGRAVGVDDERKKQQQRKLRFRIAFATATSPPATRLDSVRS